MTVDYATGEIIESTATFKAHPYADQFPMLSEPEIAELAQSIAANGQRNPIVLTTDGLVLDGRNRLAACSIAGIEPDTITYEGDDLAEYVIDCNVTRRNMSTGARAMSTALVLAADGRRENGRWKRGSVGGNGDSSNSAWVKAVQNAGVILDFKPDLAPDVVSGRIALDAAFREADAIRTSSERDKIMARERIKREREEAAFEAQRNAEIVADLTQAESAYVGLIESGSMTPKAAWAAHQEDTRKEREAEREMDRGRKATTLAVAESVRRLGNDPENFVRHFLPHEHRFVADPMRLSRSHIDAAIHFLTTVREAVTR